MSTYSVLFEFQPIYGKLIQNRANSRKIIFDEFRGVTQTDFWKNSSKIWMNFPEIGPAHIGTPQIEFSKKYWMSYPEIRLCHTPEN